MLKPVKISGAPLARGRQLGKEHAESVREAWRFYREVVFGEAYLEAIDGFSVPGQGLGV